jgi:hypothetical protein
LVPCPDQGRGSVKDNLLSSADITDLIQQHQPAHACAPGDWSVTEPLAQTCVA